MTLNLKKLSQDGGRTDLNHRVLFASVYGPSCLHFDIPQLLNVLMRIWIQLLTLMRFRILLFTANPEFGFPK